MFKNKWTYLAWISAWVFGGNLIFWSDKPLFSWNIPLCVILIAITWPIGWYFQNKAQKRIAELREIQKELDAIQADIRKTQISAETWAKIEDFLKHPETGVRRDIPKRRRPNDHNPEF